MSFLFTKKQYLCNILVKNINMSKTVTYIITNTKPQKKFSSLKELQKYTSTHQVPAREGYPFAQRENFEIEKHVVETEDFVLPGLSFERTVNFPLFKEICTELIKHIKDNHVRISTFYGPFNSYYSSYHYEDRIKWFCEFLQSLTIESEVQLEILDVHTDYKPCNNFCIKITPVIDQDYVDSVLAKYKVKTVWDCELRKNVVKKSCGGDCKTIDFSKFTEEELEFFHKVYEREHSFYIQFRSEDIMIDSSYYTGRNVHHRYNENIILDEKRQKWCLDCIHGKFKAYKK